MTDTYHDQPSPNGEVESPPALPQTENESSAGHSVGVQDDDLRSTRTASPKHRSVSVGKLLTAGMKQLAALALMLVLVGACAAYGGALLWPAQYAARAEILYEISTEKPTGFLREDRSLTTQLVLLRSRQVLAPVAARAGVQVEEFEKQVTVSLVDSSEVIRVEVRSGSREVATRQAQAIVDRYMRIAPVANSSEAARYLRAELTDVQQKRVRARAEADRQRQLQGRGTSNASAVSAAEAGLESLADREQQLLSQLDELKVAELGASRPEVVAPSYVLADQVSPRPLFAAATGALVGSVIAAGAIAVVARHWTRR